jgi:hypothetical protein
MIAALGIFVDSMLGLRIEMEEVIRSLAESRYCRSKLMAYPQQSNLYCSASFGCCSRRAMSPSRLTKKPEQFVDTFDAVMYLEITSILGNSSDVTGTYCIQMKRKSRKDVHSIQG